MTSARRAEVQHAVVSELAIGRRGRIRTYVFEIATAVGFAILGVSYFIGPEVFAVRSAIGQRVYPFDYVWSAGYILGGVLILAGMLLPQLRLRVSGLILLGTALSLQVAAAFVEAPQLRDAFNITYALACFSRAYLLTRLYLIYAVPRTGPDEGS